MPPGLLKRLLSTARVVPRAELQELTDAVVDLPASASLVTNS
jgi:hypothetical protein